MTFWKFVRASLVFYRRVNVGVLLSVVVGCAVLTGALVVGDSVRGSLAKMVEVRLGQVEQAMFGGDRFFGSDLADRLSERGVAEFAPVLQVRGLMTNGDGTVRVNRVEILGTDKRFYDTGGYANPLGNGDGVVLNEALAVRLGVSVGDEVFLRVAKSGAMPRDIPLVPDSDLSAGARVKVAAIAGDEKFGRFGLQANQVSAFNAFMPLEGLGEMVEQAGRANLLLADGEVREGAIKECWQLEDLGLEFRDAELVSRRVFVDDSLGKAALAANADAFGVLTYFVNELRAGDRAVPYSFVTAVGSDFLDEDMGDDEILINDWLAGDLKVAAGDEILLTYFVVGSGRNLIERTSAFKVVRVVAMAGKFADGSLMPDFPGLAGAENCRDWEPGIPIDLDRIRDRDEEYWDRFAGTPKGFVTLAAGQKMWGSRFGNLTAVRFGGRVNEDEIAAKILGAVDPASVGYYFQDVRASGVKAGSEGTDFGGLFLGLSMFLVAAAVIMTWL
ncbi:MAG: ABC transporter permease, partial [Planctomycetes bacterium]|nr:ABC transporter permease [Planctomycetota bacterium]